LDLGGRKCQEASLLFSGHRGLFSWGWSWPLTSI